jgi:hypothetical protein
MGVSDRTMNLIEQDLKLNNLKSSSPKLWLSSVNLF